VPWQEVFEEVGRLDAHPAQVRQPGAPAFAVQLADASKQSFHPDEVDLGMPRGVVNEERAVAAAQFHFDRLEAREELCSTGIPGGLALLHSRNPESYLFETAFLALGRTIQQIPFGAPDGRSTNLFFLIGCPDDRMHLHTLARLCLMAQKTDLLVDLRQAPDGEAMCDAILAAERAVLATHKHSAEAAE